MKTIKTKTNLLLVDETAKIKEGDYCTLNILDTFPAKLMNSYNNERNYKNYYLPAMDIREDLSNEYLTKTRGEGNGFKIIAASPKLGDLPEFETLPHNTEDNVEKLHRDLVSAIVDEVSDWNKDRYSDGQRKESWKQLFDRTRPIYEQAKTMFSEKQIIKAIRFGAEFHSLSGYPDIVAENKFIQSLTKPKEYEFVPEMESVVAPYEPAGCDFPDYVEQPIISKDNKIQGTWIPKTKQ